MLALLTLACSSPVDSAGSEAAAPVSVDTTAQDNVFAVEWSPDGDATSVWVEFGVGGAFDHRVDGTVDGGRASATVYGLRAGRRWDVRGAAANADGDVRYTETTEIDAAEVPATLPEVELLTPPASDDAAEGFILTETMVDGYAAVAVLARDGEYVWWRVMPHGETIFEAIPSADGQWIEWGTTGDGGGVYRRRLDGSDEQFFPVPGMNHGLHRLDDGSAWAVPVDEYREVDGQTVHGDQLVEVSTSDGSTRVAWSAWDSLAYTPPEDDDEEDDHDDEDDHDEPLVDWTHMNSCDYEPASGKYWISLRNLSMVVQVDRPSRQVDWTLGGDEGAFTLEGGAAFGGQHSPVMVDGGVLLFDNGPTERGRSRAVRYALDTTNLTYTEAWSYDPMWSSYTETRGNVEPLADGGALAGWGDVGEVVQLDAQSQVVWEARIGVGGVGFTHLLPSFGGVTR